MPESLSVEQLYNRCDPKIFKFSSTEELKPLKNPIGQDDAIESIKFGASIKQDGYNLFVMGESGSGKHSVVTNFLKKRAKKEDGINDWCYVNNFKNYQKPIAIKLKSGSAHQFKDDIIL